MSSLKKIKKRFGRLKKLPYLCKTKSEIKSEKKIEKRFGRLKNSSYLCETKNKWSVRLLDSQEKQIYLFRTSNFSVRKQSVRILYGLQKRYIAG